MARAYRIGRWEVRESLVNGWGLYWITPGDPTCDYPSMREDHTMFAGRYDTEAEAAAAAKRKGWVSKTRKSAA